MDIQKTAQKKQKSVDDMLTELAGLLKHYRFMNQLSRVQMGEHAGVSYPLIEGIENGKTKNIELKKLIQIANSVGYTFELELKPVK